MKPLKLPLVALLLGVVGCGPKETAKQPAATNQTDSANPITAPLDYVGAVGRAAQHSAKVIDTVQISNAIRQFHAVEDRYPKDLGELVSSGYLVSVPQMPPGQRIEYNPNTGQVRVVRQSPPAPPVPANRPSGLPAAR
ncbi:MAG: hypothetical protein H7A45_08925 [Verrucomicrobiales bacterium]|nr:hypothetical protein [Verrucomicrobiales bacterium]